MVAHQTHVLFRMELFSIERDDTSRFLTAMLERMQAKRGEGGCIRVPEDAEDAAFFVQRVAIHIVGHVIGKIMRNRLNHLWPMACSKKQNRP